MYHSTQNKKKSRWKARNFRNAQTAKKILVLTRFGSNWKGKLGNYELCDARRHFALDFSVICIYLLEIFCFCFVLADIIYIQHSRLGKIHGKWYDQIGPLCPSRTSRHPCPEGIFPVPPSAFCAFSNQRMNTMIRITTELRPYGLGSLRGIRMSTLPCWSFACGQGFFVRELQPYGRGLDQRSLCLWARVTSICTM